MLIKLFSIVLVMFAYSGFSQHVINTANASLETESSFINVSIGDFFIEDLTNGEIIISGVPASIQVFVLGTEESNVAGINEVNIYPNPASTQLTIELPTKVSGDFVMEIIDLTGTTVRTEIINSNSKKSLEIKDMVKGIYLISVTSQENNNISEIRKLKIE